MGMIQASRKCRNCGRKTLHARRSFGFGWGCLLTILTAGFFLPVWLLIKIGEGLLVSWKCQQCGGSRIL
jgi:hypothetical protein